MVEKEVGSNKIFEASLSETSSKNSRTRMVLIVFANDFITMPLANGNVKHTSNINKWNVENITFASLIIGTLLVAEGAIGILIGLNYFHLELDQLSTFVMTMLIFTSLFRTYIVWERNHFWSSRPGWELRISTVIALIGFTLLGTCGVIIPSLTLLEVLFAMGFSAIFTFGIDLPKYYAFRKFGL